MCHGWGMCPWNVACVYMPCGPGTAYAHSLVVCLMAYDAMYSATLNPSAC
jgi:hypothetical protein